MSNETDPSPTSVVATHSELAQSRLLFLDGLRGLAAFWVVLHHAYLEQPSLKKGVPFAGSVFEYGRLAVDVFIVLSGFSLTLAVARSPERKLKSVGGFFPRRAWRILPPYYAAVVLSLLCTAFVPGMNIRRGAHWDITLPAFTPGVLISHLFLVQDFSAAWVYKINHALWSIATECQLYILFPFILLPLWRRAGVGAMLVFSLAAGIGCYYLLPSLHAARLWYVALFSMGMGAAIVAASPDAAMKRVREQLAWGWIALGAVAVTAGSGLFWHVLARHEWIPDFLVGGGSCSVILFCAAPGGGGARHWLLRVLESRPAVWLGVGSYSLYLIHPPVIAGINIAFEHVSWANQHHLLVMTTVGVGGCVLAGWLFHICVEQWFIPRGDPRRLAVSSPVIAGN